MAIVQITFSPSPVAGGMIVAQPVPIGGLGLYEEGTQVTLVALNYTGYTFTRWSGDIGTANPTDNPIAVVAAEGIAITAEFTGVGALTYHLQASVEPVGGGVIEIAPTEPAGGYAPNTTVTITAKPADGYQFSEWSGSVINIVNPNTVIMNQDKILVARFVTKEVTIDALSIIAGIGILGLLALVNRKK
jgi:hypothetical protein